MLSSSEKTEEFVLINLGAFPFWRIFSGVLCPSFCTKFLKGPCTFQRKCTVIGLHFLKLASADPYFLLIFSYIALHK